MTITLRIAGPQDAALIGSLHGMSWRSAYTNVLSADYLAGPVMDERGAVWAKRFAANDPSLHVIIAEEDGQALGFAGIYGGSDPVYGTLLDNLHLLPQAKGQGLGKLLLCEAARWTLAHYPGQTLYLTVWEVNTPARDFYQRMGGEEVERLMHTKLDGTGEAPILRVVFDDVERLARL